MPYFSVSDITIYIGFDMPRSRNFVERADRDWTQAVAVTMMAVATAFWTVLFILDLVTSSSAKQKEDKAKESSDESSKQQVVVVTSC